jgi:hypothetical protein
MNISAEAGNWLGWIGIILAIIGFFWQPVLMGIVALILGVIGLFSPQKGVNWGAVILAVIVLIYSAV